MADTNSTNTDVLVDIVTTLVDVADGVEEAVVGPHNAGAVFSEFASILPDLYKLLPEVGQIPASLKAFDAQEAGVLVAAVQEHLHVPEGKAKAITDAALTLAQHLSSGIYADVQKLVAAAKGK